MTAAVRLIIASKLMSVFVGTHGDPLEFLELAEEVFRSDAAICTFPGQWREVFARPRVLGR